MQCLEVSGVVRPIYGSLGVKRLNTLCNRLLLAIQLIKFEWKPEVMPWWHTQMSLCPTLMWLVTKDHLPSDHEVLICNRIFLGHQLHKLFQRLTDSMSIIRVLYTQPSQIMAPHKVRACGWKPDSGVSGCSLRIAMASAHKSA